MIITKKIILKVSSKNLTHYLSKGFHIKTGDIIEIKPEDLPLTSKTKVECECDICKKIKNILYFTYLRNIEKYGYYTCGGKCASYKIKKTSNQKYGVDSFTQTDEYLIKSRKTKKYKYGDEKYINVDKQKQTNLERYGVEFYMSSDEFRQKSIKYNIENRIEINKKISESKNHINIDDMILKIKETKKYHHDDENFNNREKYKETCLNVFGVDNPMKNPIILNKLQNIIFEKYGVYHPAQNPEIYQKMINSGYHVKKFRDTDIYYQGTYELDFLNRYYDQINIKRGERIKYQYNKVDSYYYPDFYIKDLNLIVEIKSSRWFEEQKDKNLLKEKYCKMCGFNFIFIIDKNYEIFEKIIKHLLYKEKHCWQYELKMKNLEKDITILDFDPTILTISDFKFEYVDKNNITKCKEIKNFIEKYEWLGNMPNRPTHRFAAYYKNILSGVVIMATPNSFSKLLGENTKNIEKLISRGASISWSPKNLASSLIMWSIRWMVKNTEFKLFTAYSDTEAKEIGTIYQACNFTYLGQDSGSNKLYFDLENLNLGWTTGRNFRKISAYKKYAKKLGYSWLDEWSTKYTMNWYMIPSDISEKLKNESKEKLNNCLVRFCNPKHKYCYILGKTKKETKKLRKIFFDRNIEEKYPNRSS